jgi:hypothetical protein
LTQPILERFEVIPIRFQGVSLETAPERVLLPNW